MGLVEVQEDLQILEQRVKTLVDGFEGVRRERDALRDENLVLRNERDAVRSQLTRLVDRIERVTGDE